MKLTRKLIPATLAMMLMASRVGGAVLSWSYPENEAASFKVYSSEDLVWWEMDGGTVERSYVFTIDAGKRFFWVTAIVGGAESEGPKNIIPKQIAARSEKVGRVTAGVIE